MFPFRLRPLSALPCLSYRRLRCLFVFEHGGKSYILRTLFSKAFALRSEGPVSELYQLEEEMRCPVLIGKEHERRRAEWHLSPIINAPKLHYRHPLPV
jgi:hypothetical protein